MAVKVWWWLSWTKDARIVRVDRQDREKVIRAVKAPILRSFFKSNICIAPAIARGARVENTSLQSTDGCVRGPYQTKMTN